MGVGRHVLLAGWVALLVQSTMAELSVSGRMGREPDAEGALRPLLHLVIAAPAGDATPVPHLSTVLVMDRSGSMRDSLTWDAKRALADWVRRQPPTDRFGLVLSAGTAYTEIQPLALDRPEHIATTLLGMDIRGQTVLHAGLTEARRKAADEPSEAGWLRRVVVVSDGRVTGGITQPSVFRLLAHEMARSEILVSAIALGNTPRLEQLTAITEGAGGRLDAVETEQELRRALDAGIQAARTCAVAGITVRIQGQPGWRPVACRGTTPQLNKRRRTASVNIGLLSPGATQDLFVTFRATEASPAAAQATIQVGWLDPGTGTRHTNTVRVAETEGAEDGDAGP